MGISVSTSVGTSDLFRLHAAYLGVHTREGARSPEMTDVPTEVATEVDTTEVATEVCDPPESERLRPESSDGVSSYRGIPIVLTLPSGEPHRHFIGLRQLSTLGDLHAEIARTCARLRIHTEGGFQ